MSLLCTNNYISRPTYEQWRTLPVPEPVYWLDWKGILWVAAQHNLKMKLPTDPTEDDIRELAKQLRRKGIRWLREPRWLQLPHDLAVADFRFAVERDLYRLAVERALNNYRNVLNYDQCRLIRYASYHLHGFFALEQLVSAFCGVSAPDGGHRISCAVIQDAANRIDELGLLRPSIVPNLERFDTDSMIPHLTMEDWIYESKFRSEGDVVEYHIKDRDGVMRKASKRVYPDSYWVILDQQRLDQGYLARARFLLELDNSTHPGKRFGSEKVAPGLAYIQSPAYKKRFGANSGRWLVVTTGKVRRRNLIRQTQDVIGADADKFLFTTLHLIKMRNVLTAPIWYRGDSEIGSEVPMPLFPEY
jgi:hypothetical protein